MTTTIVTVPFKVHSARQFLESVIEPANTVYYAFAGNHIPYDGGDSTIPTLDNSPSSIAINAYQNMIFGKQITASDMQLMIRRVDWTANTVYDMYVHDDPELYDKDFFVVTDAGSYYHVYKCLNNNNSANSTVQPDFASATQDSDLFDVNDGYYKTSDGYQWKYMYSIDQATFDKFATSTYIPFIANTTVQSAARAGSIDVITVTSGGSRYDNYFSGIFSSNDLRVSSNAAALANISSQLLYSLGDNQSAANSSGSVVVTAGQSNVVGTSTTFTSDFQVGNYVKVQNTTAYEVKRIASITNNTLMTIAGSFSNTFAAANISLTFVSVASQVNAFYTNCVMKIVGGTGSGQYRTITNYINDGYKKIAVIASPFTTNPDTTSRFEITPLVLVVGNGTETTNTVARALVNSAAANAIYNVEILERGAGYITATANVLFSSALSVANVAILKPIMSPPSGHGSDPALELDASSIGMTVKFQNTESNTVTVNNDFRQIGILKDPLWANVEINHTKLSDGSAGSDGTFAVGETIYQYTALPLVGTVSVSTTSNVCNGTSTLFTESFAAGNNVLIKSGNSWFRGVISSITNTTQIILSTNSTFTNTAASVYRIDLGASGIVTSVLGGGVTYATNVSSGWVASQKFIGNTSHAVANVANVEINNVGKGSSLTVFNQLISYSGTFAGSFQDDEVVYQGSLTTANARLHSTNATHIMVTNQNGNISLTDTIVGNNSQAVLTLTNKYNGDLVVGSGDTIYLQNGLAVTRSNTQTEHIKIIIDF